MMKGGFSFSFAELGVKCALTVWLLLLSRVAGAASCPATQSKDESALVKIEHTWAKALEQRDAEALSCLLAEEFQDAGSDGALTDRPTTLDKAAHHAPVHHELSDLKARVYGDFGVIRGLASAVDAQGRIVARVRFTDVYVYREGRWQAVAGHESALADASH